MITFESHAAGLMWPDREKVNYLDTLGGYVDGRKEESQEHDEAASVLSGRTVFYY